MTAPATERVSASVNAAPRQAWTYVSGRVTALETALLPRQFFEEVARAAGAAAARAVLAKSHYRAAFGVDASAVDYSAAIGAYCERLAADVLAASPPHVMKAFLEVPRRYPAFRKLFLRRSLFNEPAAVMEEAFDVLASTREEHEALAAHKAMLRDRESPQAADSVSRSLYLDSAACTAMLALAALADEEGVGRALLDRTALTAWSAILRNRWNGTPSASVRRWFVLPPGYEALVETTDAKAESDPASGVVDYLSRPAGAVLRALGPAEVREDVDAAAASALREDVAALRYVPFGPERVIAYLFTLEIEGINLRIAFAAAAEGIEPARAVSRLRREYV